MRFVILLVLVMVAGRSAQAQPTNAPPRVLSLSLRDCLERALQCNLDLQIEHLTAEMARFNLSGAYEGYVPTFTVRAVHDHVAQPGNFDAQKFNPDFPYDQDADTVGPELKGVLPWGLSYDFGAFGRETHAVTDLRSDLDHFSLFPGGFRDTNNFTAETRVTLQQHLLKDFWIDPTRQTVLIRRKELGMSRQALRFQAMKTVLAVEIGYYDLVAARERVRVQEKALELRQQMVAETKRRVEVGDLPRLDAEQVETQLENTLAALAGAQEFLLARQNALKALVTDDFSEWADVAVQPTEVLLAFKPDANRQERFAVALKNRPDLIEARLAVEKGDVVVKFLKNQLFPNLDLVGRYGGLGVNDDAGGAVGDAFSFGNPVYYYGVVLSFPLSTVAQNGKYRAGKAARQIAQLQLKKAEQGVLVQVADLCDQTQFRFSQVESTRKARTYAEAALAAEQKKLQNGFSTSFVVLDLQQTLTAARLAEVQALVDFNRALAELAFAEGGLLEKHRLAVEVK